MSTNNKLVVGKFYSNLYKISVQLLQQVLNNKCRCFIISSNSISLIAGLTFYLLQNHKLNYRVIYLDNTPLAQLDNEDIIFVLGTPSLEMLTNSSKWIYHFSYEGDEKGILCL